MTVSLLAIFFSAFSLNANAEMRTLSIEPQETFSQQNTHDVRTDHPSYAEMSAIFIEGTEPTVSEAIGIWSGRCAYTEKKGTLYGSVLIVSNAMSTPDDGVNHGPLFPAPPPEMSPRLAVGGHGQHPAADRYDNLTRSDERDLLALVESLASNSELTASSKEGSLFASNKTGNLNFAVRKHDGAFYAQVTTIRDEGEYKAGAMFAACYFFKKILN